MTCHHLVTTQKVPVTTSSGDRNRPKISNRGRFWAKFYRTFHFVTTVTTIFGLSLMCARMRAKQVVTVVTVVTSHTV